MTDIPPQSSSPAPQVTPRRIKIVLGLSLALNLAVAGLVLGAWLGHGPDHRMPRDLSFGPFTEALRPEDRQALKEALFARGTEFRAAREAARAEFETLVTALRAEPFDPAAFKAALGAIELRNAERLQLGRSLLEARIVEMTTDERLAFAKRLEDGLRMRKVKN